MGRWISSVEACCGGEATDSGTGPSKAISCLVQDRHKMTRLPKNP